LFFYKFFLDSGWEISTKEEKEGAEETETEDFGT
jgi:hypothetical protein